MNSFPLKEEILLSNKTPALRPLPQKPTSIASQSTPPLPTVNKSKKTALAVSLKPPTRGTLPVLIFVYLARRNHQRASIFQRLG